MIAQDTGYSFIDEAAVGYFKVSKAKTLLAYNTNFALHCPALSRHVHKLADRETAIVFMFRKIDDIVASQNRIHWDDRNQKRLYEATNDPREISEIKYTFWKEKQKSLIEHAYEVEYESLSAHPLWLGAEERKNFTGRQTSVERDVLLL